MSMDLFLSLISLLVLAVMYVNFPKKPEYGCNCEGREYIEVRKTHGNTFYKCTICGTEDHIWVYEAGRASINPRMWKWHHKQVIDNTFNRRRK